MFTVVVDAWPAWGSDFGGPPASIPAFALLTFAVLGVRLTVRRVALIAVGTVAVVSVVSVLDWLRPPADQSHLGKFVQTVIDGGAWDVMKRKLAQNLDILFSNVLSRAGAGRRAVRRPGAAPAELVGGATPCSARSTASPVLRAGLLSGLVMWVIGFSLNDSGTAIPAVSATLAIPLVIAASITALGSAGDSPAPPGPPAASHPSRRDQTPVAEGHVVDGGRHAEDPTGHVGDRVGHQPGQQHRVQRAARHQGERGPDGGVVPGQGVRRRQHVRRVQDHAARLRRR